MVACRWENPLEGLDDLSGGEPVSGELVRVVPDVTDVPVSLSFMVTVFLPCALIRNLQNRGPFLSPKSVHVLYRCAGRDEVRRLTSESASAFNKKDDAAYTCP